MLSSCNDGPRTYDACICPAHSGPRCLASGDRPPAPGPRRPRRAPPDPIAGGPGPIAAGPGAAVRGRRSTPMFHGRSTVSPLHVAGAKYRSPGIDVPRAEMTKA